LERKVTFCPGFGECNLPHVAETYTSTKYRSLIDLAEIAVRGKNSRRLALSMSLW
jgi:hypothetical protein